MDEILNLPAVGIIICIVTYRFGVWLREKSGVSFVNPLLVAIILSTALVVCTPLSLENFRAGGNMVAFFILPATVVLAVTVYRQRALAWANLVPLIAGCVAGSCTSIVSIKVLGRLFALDDILTNSLLPKSVTTAIALDLAEKYGGVPAITVVAITITGLSASIIGPALISILPVKDSVAAGCALGMAGHAIGTARALQSGELEGGMAGISLCFAGVITSLLFLLLG